MQGSCEHKRALSWDDAVDAGFRPDDYQFKQLPIGRCIGALDWKIWGKTPCLACYFTAEDGSRFRLTAFRARTGPGAGHWYTAQDGLLDMSDVEVMVGQRFHIESSVNGKGKPAWISVKPVESP